MDARCAFTRTTIERLVLVGMLVLPAGCGSDGLHRVVVTGSINLNGAPIDDGQIRFIPEIGTVGPLTVAPIRQGQYRCDVNGGVPMGTHRIEILAWDRPC